MRLTLSSLTLLLVSSASATTLRIALPPAHAPVLSHTSLSTSAFLHSSPPIRAPLSQWGGFTLDLSSAISNDTTSAKDSEQRFLLDVVSKQYIFAPMLVALNAKSGNIKGVWEVRRGEMWGDGGEGMRAVEVRDTEVEGVREITARVTGSRDFYEQRAGFSPLSLLKNPMILLAIAALGLMFGMPYLMENMDPETRAEFEQAQKQGPLTSIMGAAPGNTASSSSSNGNSQSPRGERDEAAATVQNSVANFDLAGWMAGQQTKIGSGESKSSGSDIRGGGTKRRG